MSNDKSESIEEQQKKVIEDLFAAPARSQLPESSQKGLLTKSDLVTMHTNLYEYMRRRLAFAMVAKAIGLEGKLWEGMIKILHHLVSLAIGPELEGAGEQGHSEIDRYYEKVFAPLPSELQPEEVAGEATHSISGRPLNTEEATDQTEEPLELTPEEKLELKEEEKENGSCA